MKRLTSRETTIILDGVDTIIQRYTTDDDVDWLEIVEDNVSLHLYVEDNKVVHGYMITDGMKSNTYEVDGHVTLEQYNNLMSLVEHGPLEDIVSIVNDIKYNAIIMTCLD